MAAVKFNPLYSYIPKYNPVQPTAFKCPLIKKWNHYSFIKTKSVTRQRKVKLRCVKHSCVRKNILSIKNFTEDCFQFLKSGDDGLIKISWKSNRFFSDSMWKKVLWSGKTHLKLFSFHAKQRGRKFSPAVHPLNTTSLCSMWWRQHHAVWIMFVSRGREICQCL